MKFPLSPLTAICLSVSALMPAAQAEISSIRMRVEATNKNESDKGSSSQTRILNVILDNSAQEQADLKVKYVVFGRDASSKDIVAVAQGELPVTVKPRSTEKVQTPEAKASFTDGKPAKGQTKKTEPTGQKIVGHGVQVLKGETVVAEAYEPASMKESFGKAAAATPAAGAKK